MNTYNFGVTAAWPKSKAKRRKAMQIAREEGAWFVQYEDDAFWFGKRNQGAPFDEAVADSVRERFAAAGIR
jgi:hypothetical protein